jgi:hypothetical protein
MNGLSKTLKTAHAIARQATTENRLCRDALVDQRHGMGRRNFYSLQSRMQRGRKGSAEDRRGGAALTSALCLVGRNILVIY